MNEPRYQFWRPIQPAEGQPIPDGAMFKHPTGKKWQPAYRGERWIGWPADLEWRVPVEVVPVDVAVNIAVDLCLRGAVCVVGMTPCSYPLSREKTEELRELVIAKLRELSGDLK